MPTIISSLELKDKFSEISSICRSSHEPVFITKNGHGDLALMSIELYDVLIGKLELYRLLSEGRTAINEGRKLPLDKAIAELRRRNMVNTNG